MKTKEVVIEKLQIGGIEVEDYQATILDLSHINQSYERLEVATVDGILGGDILKDYKVVIDYEKKE